MLKNQNAIESFIFRLTNILFDLFVKISLYHNHQQPFKCYYTFRLITTTIRTYTGYLSFTCARQLIECNCLLCCYICAISLWVLVLYLLDFKRTIRERILTKLNSTWTKGIPRYIWSFLEHRYFNTGQVAVRKIRFIFQLHVITE